MNFDDPKCDSQYRRASEYKGKTYSVRPGTTELINVASGIWWNKTQFENLGIPNLYELYENGEWDWDKMFEVAELATRDLDNDGEIDVYGFGANNLAYDLMHNNGALPITKTENGIDIDFNDPKITEALKFAEKLINPR